MSKVLGNIVVAMSGALGAATIVDGAYLIGVLNLSFFLYYLMKDIRGE